MFTVPIRASAPTLVPHAVARGALLALCVSAWLIAVGGLSPAARAQAQQVPQVVEDNLDSATQFYAKESGVAQAPCDAGCSALVKDLDRPPTVPKDPMPSRIIKSLVDKAVEVGGQVANKIPWKLPDSPLGWTVAGGLIVANAVVWKVYVLDPILRAYFIKAPEDVIAANGNGLSLMLSDGSPINGFIRDPAPSGQPPNPVPIGLLAFNSTMDLAQRSACTATCTCNARSWASAPKPAGMVEYSWRWGFCNGGNVPYMSYGWRVPLEDSLGFINGLDSYDAPNSPVTFSVNGTLMTLQELKDRLQGVLTSDDPEYTAVGQWMCAVFGGECQNPKDAYPTVPDCVGATPAACEQDFRDAGFTGDITTKTVDADQAVMEQQAGKVTDTYPHAGDQIAAPRDIIIYANPDPMPAMTAADDALADTLEDQNPDTIGETNKKTIARTCRTLVQRASRPAGDCTSLPIFVVGRDALKPAQNDFTAILNHPEWVALNRRVDSPNTRWYRNQPGCLDEDRIPINAECDEYPYWSSMQAQNGPLNTATPQIVWTPSQENKLEGNALKKFYSTDGPGAFPWRGCDVQARQLTDVVPTVESTYLVVPIPVSFAIKTTGICNHP